MSEQELDEKLAEAESDAIRFLLDGLDVNSLSELHGLVADAKFYRQMRADGFRFAEGVSPLLMGVPLS